MMERRNLRADPFAWWERQGLCSVAVAIVGSAVVGAGASIAGANSAAGAEKSAVNSSNQLLSQQYDQTRADLAAYNSAGQSDMAAYNNLLGQGPGGTAAEQSTLSSLPGYQFTLQQGLKSTQNSAAARGLGVSGAALKGAATYATGLANSTYGTYANQLLSGAQVGEQAAAQTGQYGTSTAQSEAGNTVGAGNATAAADVASGNAISSGLSNGLTSLYLFNALGKGSGSGLYGSGYQGYANDGTAQAAQVAGLY